MCTVIGRDYDTCNKIKIFSSFCCNSNPFLPAWWNSYWLNELNLADTPVLVLYSLLLYVTKLGFTDVNIWPNAWNTPDTQTFSSTSKQDTDTHLQGIQLNIFFDAKILFNTYIYKDFHQSYSLYYCYAIWWGKDLG